jgi:nitrogen fixation protein NifU and related proteins
MDDNLYREELMEVYKSTVNRGTLKDPSVEAFKKNVMCGDEITLQLQIEKDVIKDAKFDGVACAVSVIASNFMLENIIGKTLEEARQITKEDLLEMIGVNLTTSRVKCATLVLEALQNAIKKYSQNK